MNGFNQRLIKTLATLCEADGNGGALLKSLTGGCLVRRGWACVAGDKRADGLRLYTATDKGREMLRNTTAGAAVASHAGYTLQGGRPMRFGSAAETGSIFGWSRDDSIEARVNIAAEDIARFGCFRAYRDSRSWSVVETKSGKVYAVARSDQGRPIAKALKKLCGSLSTPRDGAMYTLEWLKAGLAFKA